jgi:NAD(P)H-dependent FMN reductase
MSVLIIHTNLAENSKTAYLAGLLQGDLAAQGADVIVVDLAVATLPFCDGTTCYKDPRVHEVTALVKSCAAAVWVSPIYNYDLNAAAKNFLELTNQAWAEKVVGFVVQAGGARSYMAPMAFANSLMLDHRCRIVPRFVYIEREDFSGSVLAADGEPRQRLVRLARELLAQSKYGAD